MAELNNERKNKSSCNYPNGFIGIELCNFLEEKGYIVRRIQRNKGDGLFQIENINSKTNWNISLR